MLKFLKVFDPTYVTRPIDPRALNATAIAKYRRYPELMQAASSWTILADRELYNMLNKLARIVDETQPPSNKVHVLYRGFDTDSFQESLGFKGTPQIGTTARYTAKDRLISTTTSIEVAKAFGDVVVEMHVNLSKVNALRFTDELMFVIADIQQTDPATQFEVALMPPIDVECKVVHLD